MLYLLINNWPDLTCHHWSNYPNCWCFSAHQWQFDSISINFGFIQRSEVQTPPHHLLSPNSFHQVVLTEEFTCLGFKPDTLHMKLEVVDLCLLNHGLDRGIDLFYQFPSVLEACWRLPFWAVFRNINGAKLWCIQQSADRHYAGLSMAMHVGVRLNCLSNLWSLPTQLTQFPHGLAYWAHQN